MDNCFIVALSTLEMIKIKQQVCWTKIGYSSALWLETNICKKRNVTTLISAHQAKEAMQIWQWLVGTTTGQFTWDLFSVTVRLKESVLKNNSQINFIVTTRTWILSTEWTRKWPRTRLVSDWYQSWSSERLVLTVMIPVCNVVLRNT